MSESVIDRAEQDWLTRRTMSPDILKSQYGITDEDHSE